MNFKELEEAKIIDISTLKINKKKKKEEKMISYINQAKTPYLYKYNGFTVKINYTDENSVTLEQLLNNYIQNL